MTTIREQILAAAVTAIETAVAPVTVYRSRSEAFRPGQLPAVVLRPESDVPGDRDSTLCWCPWSLTMVVDVVVAAAPPCQVADPIVEDVHAALMAAEDLGLPQFGVDISPGACEWSDEHQGELVGMTRCRWVVRYRTAWDSLASSGS